MSIRCSIDAQAAEEPLRSASFRGVDHVDPAAADTLAGRPLGLEWDLGFQISFTFEVPLERVASVVPAGVELVEPVPGRALLNLIHARYAPGTLDEPEPFDEIVCSLIAQPDLSVPMPTPRQTLFVLDVASDSAAFVEYKVPALRMPVRHDPSLRAEPAPDGRGTTVSDGRGPLFSLVCGEASPRYKARSLFGQYFAQTDDALHHGVWSWWGAMHESQRHRRGRSELNVEHPRWAELGLSRISARDCFMQQVTRPGEGAHMRTYAPTTR